MPIELSNKLYGDVKVFILGKIILKTALHIGTGTGDHHTDSTVMKDMRGMPFIPGSSMKGVLRSIAESLCEVVLGEDGGEESCFLDKDSGVLCISAQRGLLDDYNKILAGEKPGNPKQFLDKNRCLPCKLFGSPVVASKISIADLCCIGEEPDIRVRDGVGIDRDTETAREGVKFDFETVSPGTSFSFEAIVDKPEEKEARLLAIALRELELGNAFLGGNTSRGLGRFRLKIDHIRYLSYTKNAILDYLLNSDPSSEDPLGRLPEVEDVKGTLDQLIKGHSELKEGQQNAQATSE